MLERPFLIAAALAVGLLAGVFPRPRFCPQLVVWRKGWCGPLKVMIGLLMAIHSFSASAQMYSDGMLEAKLARIKENLEYTIKTDIPAHTAPAYQAAAAQVVPDIRTRNFDFLDFLHEGPVVPVGVDALQFLDDLATVQAWLVRNGCDGSVLPNYIFHHATPNGRSLDPISAFGLNRDSVLNDSFVKKISDDVYNTALWFLLAHEVGHVAFGQIGPSTLDQENAADAFALDVMRRKRLHPVGIVLYMMVIALYDQKIATRTHATNGERLRRIADAVRRAPQDFVARVDQRQQQHDSAVILKVADQLSGLADALQQIRESEKRLAEGGEKVEDVYRKWIFNTVDYSTACVARP